MQLKLQILDSEFSVCQLKPDEPVPNWIDLNSQLFVSISRTDDELSMIVPSPWVPDDTKAQREFICFRVIGELEFDVIGVIAAISRVLAEVKIPILSVSTYNTDYFLVSKSRHADALSALGQSGYEFVE